MKLIRHLLSHLLLFTLLVAVGAAYFYRHQLLPGRYVQDIDNYAMKIHPKLASFRAKTEVVIADKQEQEPQIEKPAVEVIYVDGVALVNEPVQEKTVANDTAETVTPEIKMADKSVKEPAPEVVKNQITNDVPVAEDVVTTKPIEPEVIVTEATETDQKNTSRSQQTAEATLSAASDKEAADYLTVLRDARTAFGKGEMDIAVEKYNELIELEDEADFHGELGNVYYAMGKWDQAGASYYEAAIRLIENKQMAQVGYLQRVIQGLDAERAEKLAKQLANQ